VQHQCNTLPAALLQSPANVRHLRIDHVMIDHGIDRMSGMGRTFFPSR
jgi:hypothetical protein